MSNKVFLNECYIAEALLRMRPTTIMELAQIMSTSHEMVETLIEALTQRGVRVSEFQMNGYCVYHISLAASWRRYNDDS